MVKTANPAVEIEIDGPHNESLYYRPLQRSIRGRFDLMRIGEPMAKVAANEWPHPIPSQRLGIDDSGNGYLIETLHADEHATVREKIEDRGMRLEPERVTFEAIDIPTWQYFLRAAVNAGIAKVVNGRLPDSIDDSKVKKDWLGGNREPTTEDKLTAVIERQNLLFEKLLEKLS